MRRLHVTALGSSFAAGPGIPPLIHEAAGRSALNYAHQFATKIDADLTDLTVSGATLLDVLNEKQVTESCVFDPQLQHLPSNTDIVTLTCGGNDLNYIGGLINQTLISYLGPNHELIGSTEAPALTSAETRDRLIAVLDEVHRVAPQARVYLVQYLPIIGDDTRPLYDLAITAEHIQRYDNVAIMLAKAYYDAAEARPGWVEVVPVADVGRKHALGSKEPWVRDFSLDMLAHGPAPFHPNLAGHTAVAEILYKQVKANTDASTR